MKRVYKITCSEFGILGNDMFVAENEFSAIAKCYRDLLNTWPKECLKTVKFKLDIFYDIYLDYETESGECDIYDNGVLAFENKNVPHATTMGNDWCRPSSEYAYGLTGFRYKFDYFHVGCFYGVTRM